MPMIYRPAGFDRYLDTLATLSEEQIADERLMEELAVNHDIVNLSPAPARE